MAPDVRFPVQYEECVQAAKHFLRPEVLAQYSVDPERVAVCGDSAGGNLAAAVAQRVHFHFYFPITVTPYDVISSRLLRSYCLLKG